jgi:hypothetical protein
VKVSSVSSSQKQRLVKEAKLGEVEIPFNDIYVQEFFFQCYAQIIVQKKHFIDSTEANTYID